MFEVHILFGGLDKTQASTFGMPCKTSHACIAESGMHYFLEHVYLVDGYLIEVGAYTTQQIVMQ